MSLSIHGDSPLPFKGRSICTVLFAVRVSSLTGPCKRIVQSFALVMALGLCLPGCERQSGIPKPQTRSKADPVTKAQADRLGVAQLALRRGDSNAAEQAVRNYLMQSPNDARAIELLGDIAEHRGQAQTAAELYQTAADLSNPPSEALLDKLGMQLIATGHAFDTLGCVAVEFRTHYFNSASRAGIERLGAKLDGVLRSNQILLDGSRRDTVVYSILDIEWPSVRNNLEFRLGHNP